MRQNEAGFTFIEILISAALIAVSAMVIGGAVYTVTNDINRLELITSTSIVRMNFLSHLQNDNAWQNTINETLNTNLNCVKTQRNCAIPNSGGVPNHQPFILKDSAGNIFYDSTNQQAGFPENGGPACNTYSGAAAAGNDACPLHVDLTWVPDCGLNCTPTLVKVTVTFSYNPSSQKRAAQFSAQNYQLTVVRKAFP